LVPIVVWLIASGFGLLGERLARVRLPDSLLAPLGFCAAPRANQARTGDRRYTRHSCFRYRIGQALLAKPPGPFVVYAVIISILLASRTNAS
jgi:hypothetical protein